MKILCLILLVPQRYNLDSVHTPSYCFQSYNKIRDSFFKNQQKENQPQYPESIISLAGVG